MNAGSNTKRAGKTPTRLCKFNRFYPANKTFCKYTTKFQIVKRFDKVFLQMTIETNQTYVSTFYVTTASNMGDSLSFVQVIQRISA